MDFVINWFYIIHFLAIPNIKVGVSLVNFKLLATSYQKFKKYILTDMGYGDFFILLWAVSGWSGTSRLSVELKSVRRIKNYLVQK